MTYCPRFIHTLYCDDVRHEVGGKMTFVGAYQNEMHAELPGDLVLPKLCVVVTAQTPSDQPFKKLRVKLFLDDKILQESDVPVTLANSVDSANGEPINFYVLGIILTMQGMRFDRSGVLRVRVETESEELWAPGLHVILKNQEPASEAIISPEL